MQTTPRIDYAKIASAQEYYTALGYEELAVPWIISFVPYNATRPPNRKEFYCLDGYLNASGEQSFLELMIQGRSLTKHYCITPCFRDEPIIDATHHRSFMKLELINTDVTLENLQTMIRDATRFFSRYVPVTVIATNPEHTAFDIINNNTGIELGSYGIRSYNEHTWIYGTGVALPRLDTVINLNK